MRANPPPPCQPVAATCKPPSPRSLLLPFSSSQHWHRLSHLLNPLSLVAASGFPPLSPSPRERHSCMVATDGCLSVAAAMNGHWSCKPPPPSFFSATGMVWSSHGQVWPCRHPKPCEASRYPPLPPPGSLLSFGWGAPFALFGFHVCFEMLGFNLIDPFYFSFLFLF